MDNIVEFTKEKVVAYPKEQELCDRINDLIDEYDGELSNVSVIGILTIVSEGFK